MIKSIVFATFLALAAATMVNPAVHMKRPLCGERCTFRICKANANSNPAPIGRKLVMRAPRSPANPFICKLDGSLDRVTKTGEPVLQLDDGTMVQMSKWGPSGLWPRFPKRYFGVKKIPVLNEIGIVRKPTVEFQYRFLDDLCVVLPIKEYIKVDPNTGATTRKTATKATDCVSFQTNAPKLLFDVFWESSDDMDLSVTEPGGTTVDRLTVRSKNGKLINDNSVDGCGLLKVGRENIIYDTTFDSGEYTVTLKRGKACRQTMNGTKFTIQVLRDGDVIRTVRGRATGLNGSIAATFKITL